MKKYFCTHFNINYISFAKALACSLEVNYSDGIIFMICMDLESFEEMIKFNAKNTIIIHHESVENFIPDILFAKSNRF